VKRPTKKPAKSPLETAACLCKHPREAHVNGLCVMCDCETYVANMKHQDENQLQVMLDARVAENLKVASQPCPHTGGQKMECPDCFREWFFIRSVRN
jgi:hypothetical protein